MTEIPLHSDWGELSFEIKGKTLSRDHKQVMAQALTQALPWLNEEPLAAIHPVKLASGSVDGLLSRRSRLVLRLPRARISAAKALEGQILDVGGHEVQIGQSTWHPILAHGTLYAYSVYAEEGLDEVAFMETVARRLRELEIGVPAICGRHHVARGPNDEELHAYSLMLHGLSNAASLRLQVQGLGAHRKLGGGLFIPHKSAAAVGSYVEYLE